jgi:hypothetical protein
MVAATAEAMGTELSAEALKVFVHNLWGYPVESIAAALNRCVRELRGRNGFPPVLSVADVLDRLGVVSQSEIDDAECRAAWDLGQEYAEKFVVADCEGNYVERDATGPIQTKMVDGKVVRYLSNKPRPELKQRVRDTVRRVGGWRALKNINEEDYPHVQRRFYDEYRAWQATDAAISRGALNGVEGFKQLLESSRMPEVKRLNRVAPNLKDRR